MIIIIIAIIVISWGLFRCQSGCFPCTVSINPCEDTNSTTIISTTNISTTNSSTAIFPYYRFINETWKMQY